MNTAIRALCYGAAAVYPVLVFCLLVVLEVPLRVFALLMAMLGGVYFLSATSKKKRKSPGVLSWFRRFSCV
jgi:hypothetical protein